MRNVGPSVLDTSDKSPGDFHLTKNSWDIKDRALHCASTSVMNGDKLLNVLQFSTSK